MKSGTIPAAFLSALCAAVPLACGDGDDDGPGGSGDGDAGFLRKCPEDSVVCNVGGTEECFDAKTNCDTVIRCGSSFWGCETGKEATCSSYDVAVCCGGDDPLFCEIPDAFVGCIAATSDCSTGVDCGDDRWAFCPAGMHPNCEANTCDPL